MRAEISQYNHRGGYRPQIPALSALSPQLNLLNLHPPNKFPGVTPRPPPPPKKFLGTPLGVRLVP
jgi:hypothetical protein